MSEQRQNGFLARRGAIILFFLAMILLLPGSNILPLLDRDEPRFARATVEMMQRGEWVVPYFNNEYRFDKPVLTYWLMRAGYALFGVNEFGARFHSILSSAFLAVAIFFMGRRWLDARAGFFAALGMLTCFQMTIHGRSAVADMPMVLFVCLAMFAMAELLGICDVKESQSASRKSQIWFWIFYISLGFGFLAKGPVALIVPLLSAVLWRFVFWRRPAPWRNLKLLWGLPIMLAIIGAWGIPALVKTHGLFWKVGMGEHVVGRGLKAFNGRLPFPLYYCFTAFVSLFPWCFFVRDGWRVARGKIAGGKTSLDAFLVSWFVAPILVFSFYSTQLMHYILPGFPAFFLLLARAWSVRDEFAGEKFWRKIRIVATSSGIFFAALVLVLGFVLRSRTPAIELRDFLSSLPAKTEFGFYRFREPSLVFYSGKTFLPLETIEAARDFFAKPGPHALVLEESDRPIAGTKNARYFPDELAQISTNHCEIKDVSGVNVARGKFVSVRAIFRP